MKKIVVIGASIAGHTIAVNLRRNNKDCAITLVSEEGFPFYDRRRLPDFLAGRLKESDIFLSSEDSYEKDNINFIKEKKVSALNPKKRIIYFKEKGSLEYDFLIIASGRRFELPEIPGIKKRGIFTLYSLSDFKSFLDYPLRDTLCIVGSDEDALNLAKIIAARYKIEIKLLSQKSFENSQVPQEIEVIGGSLAEIIGEGGVQALKFKQGKTIGAAAIIFMDEVKANIDFLKDANIEMHQGLISVNPQMQTNIENIFACGAVCSRRDISEKIKSWRDVEEESISLAHHLSEIMKEKN